MCSVALYSMTIIIEFPLLLNSPQVIYTYNNLIVKSLLKQVTD